MISLKNFNYTPTQAEILRGIYLQPGITRKQLSELTEISGRSILKFVADFLEEGIVINYGTEGFTGGRNAAQLAINPDFLLILAVDVGSYSTKIGVINMHGQIIKDEIMMKKEKHKPSTITPENLRERLSDLINEFGKKRFIGIGISITGLVSSEKNYIKFSPNIPGFNNIDVIKEFEEPLGIPVYLETSARSSALAEQRYGFGKGYSNQIFISVGHSISAGIIVNGHLFTGSDGSAGEIGHVKCGTDGLRCTCGNYDCLEIYSTLPMIVGKIARKAFNFPGYSPAAGLVKDISEFDWQHVVKGIELKDKTVTEEVSDAGKRLGFVVSYLTNIINPDIIVFGGSVTELLPQVIDKATEAINEYSLISTIQNLDIKKSALGNKVALLGSAVQVMNHFFGV